MVRDGYALGAEQGAFAFQVGAAAVSVEAAEGAVGGDDAMAGDFGCVGVAAEGLSDGAWGTDAEGACDGGVGGDPTLRDAAAEFVDAGLERGGHRVGGEGKGGIGGGDAPDPGRWGEEAPGRVYASAMSLLTSWAKRAGLGRGEPSVRRA